MKEWSVRELAERESERDIFRTKSYRNDEAASSNCVAFADIVREDEDHLDTSQFWQAPEEQLNEEPSFDKEEDVFGFGGGGSCFFC